jgi:hypothetical protein
MDKINHLKTREDSLRKLDIEALPSRDPERGFTSWERDNSAEAGRIQVLVIKKTTMKLKIKLLEA